MRGLRICAAATTMTMAISSCAASPTVESEVGIGWNEPPDYRFVVESSCGERAFLGRFDVTVRGHKVVDAEALDESAEASLQHDNPADLIPTIDEMVNQFFDAIAGGADWTNMNVDNGVPTLIEIDPDTTAVDDEACYEIIDFEELGPATTKGSPPPPTSTAGTAATGSTAVDVDLVDQLFGEDPPDGLIVQQRPDHITIWDGGVPRTITAWPGKIFDVELDIAVVRTDDFDLVALDDGSILRSDYQCLDLHSRDDRVLFLDDCALPWDYRDARTGASVETPVPYVEPGEIGSPFFYERGPSTVQGEYDAEGDTHDLTSISGVDLLDGDAAGTMRLSSDGSLVAYVDHADPAAVSHFVSPVVVVREIDTGHETGRWVLDQPVTCIESNAEWVAACLGDPFARPDEGQDKIAVINLASGGVTTVTTKTRVFLPA